MRKFTTLLVVLCLVMSLPAFALNTEEVPGQLKQVVEDYLNPRDIPNEYNAERSRFELSYPLQNSLGSCSVYIYLYDDMLRVRAFSPIYAVAEHRDKVAVLLTLVNFDIDYGEFHMDFEDGEISCLAQQYVESVIPGPKEVGVMLNQPLYYLEDWGDAIMKVGLTGADPHAVYAETKEAKK